MPRGNPNFNKKNTENKNQADNINNTKENRETEQSNIKTPENNQSNIDIQEVIAKAVAEALEKQKKEFEFSAKKSRNKFVPDNARVRIETNIGGKFIISDTRGQNFFIELNGYKDGTTISFKDLKNFYGKSYKLFTSGKIVITDVVSDVDIELEDVIKDLNLTKIYFDKNKISPIDIESIFYEDVNLREFENKVTNSPEVAETILEVAYILYRRGTFNDNSKMNFLRQIFRNQNLFK
jgi:hypothetical protein